MSSWVLNKACGEKNPKKEACNINIVEGIFAVPHFSSCCRSLMCLATLPKGRSSVRHRLCLGYKCCLTLGTTRRQEMVTEKQARNWAAADHPSHLSVVTTHQDTLPALAVRASSICSTQLVITTTYQWKLESSHLTLSEEILTLGFWLFFLQI